MSIFSGLFWQQFADFLHSVSKVKITAKLGQIRHILQKSEQTFRPKFKMTRV